MTGRDGHVRSDGVLLAEDQALAPAVDGEARFRRTFQIVLVLAVFLDLVAQAIGLVPQGSSWALLAIVGALGLAALAVSASAARRRDDHG